MNRNASGKSSLRLGRLLAVVMVLVVVALAISVLMPSLRHAREMARVASFEAAGGGWYDREAPVPMPTEAGVSGAGEPIPAAQVSVFDAKIDLTPGLSVGTERPESIYEARVSASIVARCQDPKRVCQIRLPVPPEIISLADLTVKINGDESSYLGIAGNELVWTGQLPADEDADVQIDFTAVGKGVYVLERPSGKIIDRFHTELVAHHSNIRMLELSLQPQDYTHDGNKTVYTWDYEKLLVGRPIQIDVLGIAAADQLGEVVWTGPTSVIIYGILVVLATLAYRPGKLDAWMTLLLVGCFAAVFPLMYFLQDFMPLWAAMTVAFAVVLAIMTVRAVTLFGPLLGVGTGALLPGAIAALALTMTLHAKAAVQGVCMTLLAILTVVLAMMFVPRAQQNVRLDASPPQPPKQAEGETEASEPT